VKVREAHAFAPPTGVAEPLIFSRARERPLRRLRPAAESSTVTVSTPGGK
jgi:hypothetical protein